VIYITTSPIPFCPGTLFRSVDGQILETRAGEIYLSSGLVEHKPPVFSGKRTVLRYFLRKESVGELLDFLCQ
jgi:hypothetical protein